MSNFTRNKKKRTASGETDVRVTRRQSLSSGKVAGPLKTKERRLVSSLPPQWITSTAVISARRLLNELIRHDRRQIDGKTGRAPVRCMEAEGDGGDAEYKIKIRRCLETSVTRLVGFLRYEPLFGFARTGFFFFCCRLADHEQFF